MRTNKYLLTYCTQNYYLFTKKTGKKFLKDDFA